MFELLKELEGFDEVVYSESSSPLAADGIVLFDSKNNRRKIILANYNAAGEPLKIMETGRNAGTPITTFVELPAVPELLIIN